MKDLDPKATVDKELFPKLFAGEYGAEISTLLTSNAQIIHSSFYDGDLEAFIYQAAARGLLQRIPFVLTTGEILALAARPKAARRHDRRRARAPYVLRPRQRIEHAGSTKATSIASRSSRSIPPTTSRNRCSA